MSIARNTTRAGAAAVLLGLSLTGPQALGVALADGTADNNVDGTTASSSATSSSDSAAPATSNPRSGKPTRRAARSAPAAASGGRSPVAARIAQDVPTGRLRAKAVSPDPNLVASALPTLATTAAASAVPWTSASLKVQTPAQLQVQSQVQPLVAAATVAAITAPAASPPATTTTGTTTTAPPVFRSAAAVSATGIAGVGQAAGSAATANKLFASLFSPFQSMFEGIGLLVRRNFFNKAPTVNPVQLTGQSGGPITGTVGAVDPEGDRLTYSLTQSPLHGSVAIAADGTYTYTPASGFTGADSFNVAASDGRHLNLLDLRRPASTEAYIQVSQGAGRPMLTFNFSYGTGSQYWSTSARSALQTAATMLASYFVVSAPVTLTFDVTGNKSVFSSTLATAGSDLADAGAGFFGTVVQDKILTGIDLNGSAADGTIDWNFGPSWAFGSTASSGEYDFTSTAMHELLHTFGFMSNLGKPGTNTDRTWMTFDSFIVTSNGTKPFNNDFSWNTTYNSSLTSGLYFAGPQAVAVYGGPVPLYTPSPWENGSSVSHLNDNSFYGSNDKLMNARVSMGTGIRTLSTVELAILKDLGYQVNNQPVYALLFIGMGFLRRRKPNRR